MEENNMISLDLVLSSKNSFWQRLTTNYPFKSFFQHGDFYFQKGHNFIFPLIVWALSGWHDRILPYKQNQVFTPIVTNYTFYFGHNFLPHAVGEI